MPDITLKDILIDARQESYKMRHFFVGAEHLFIALLSSTGTVVCDILRERGFTPEYVMDATRRKMGKGGKHRLWAGVPNTPRVEVLLGIANDLALEAGREEISERDLLIAMLEENDNLPVRVLAALGIQDLADLRQRAQTHVPSRDSQRAYVKIDFAETFEQVAELPKEQAFILRQAFADYDRIRIEGQLSGTGHIFVITPIHQDDREDASVIVKLNPAEAILDEMQWYKAFVSSRLPTTSARITTPPVVPETSDLGVLKYTLPTGDLIPSDLISALRTWDSHLSGAWLQKHLFSAFGYSWWQRSKPYKFQVWREYDWILPSLWTLKAEKDKPTPSDAQVIQMPTDKIPVNDIQRGDIVVLENFVIEAVIPERNTLKLAAGYGTDAIKAYKVDVVGVDFSTTTYYRGEVLDSIWGTIQQTRREYLSHVVESLKPEFDITLPELSLPNYTLPNPIDTYYKFLNLNVSGLLSTVHGNLYPGNIIAATDRDALLIDFAHVREGHTLFDWATLEIGLLSQVVIPTLDGSEDWGCVYNVVKQLALLNDGIPLNDFDADDKRFAVITEVRKVAQQCLHAEDDWSEYFIALAFCSLGAMTSDALPIVGRRLLFLVSALAFKELQTRFQLPV